MGSKAIQGELWGKKAADWASIQEQTGKAGYQYVLDQLRLSPADHLLDIGCGSGIFADLAQQAGAATTAIDASEPLLEEAKRRNPSVHFLAAEMEELPFADKSFTVVCGFNSFQYAADIRHAFAEAKRVLKDQGKLAVMIWGNRADCEAAVYLKALGALMPPPPAGAPGPFALSEERQLERLLHDAGFSIIANEDVISIWKYTDPDTALRGLLSAGPAAKAIANAGYEKASGAVMDAIKPYVTENGAVVLRNKFRVVIAAN